MFKKLAAILNALEKAKGKAKEAVLRRCLGDEDVKWMLKMALDQGYSFGIKEIPAYDGSLGANDTLVTMINWAKSATGITDKDMAAIHRALCYTPEHYMVGCRILRKDLRCGISATTVNKVFPGLVFKVPYQRCSGFDRIDRMTWPALLQRKANGLFAYMMPDGSFLSRKGMDYRIEGCQIADTHATIPLMRDKILIGEMVVDDGKGGVLPRAVGNGIINSFVKGKGDLNAAPHIRAYVWGWLSQEEFATGLSFQSYLEKFNYMTDAGVPFETGAVRIIETIRVSDLDEAIFHNQQHIANGEEGSVVKSISPSFVWRNESSCDYQIKMKAEAEAEFIIIGAYGGEAGKKYEGMLGGVVVQSSEGLIVSDVGTGFSDKQRQLGIDYWVAKAGEIATIKFNGVTESVETEVKALDHPRFVEVREDKTEADTLEYCLKALKARA